MKRATALAVPVRTLFWFTFSYFVAIHPWSVHCSGGSFNVTDVNKDKKLVTSARYDKQHVYAYLQLFSR